MLDNKGNPSAWTGVLVRGGALTTALCAALFAARLGMMVSLAIVALALLFYLVLRPRQTAPIRYSAAQAIMIPDLMGVVLTAVFVALPIWAAEEAPMAGLYILLSPVIALGLALLVVGWLWESTGVTPLADRFVHTRGFTRTEIAYADITGFSPWRSDLPAWMRALTPILIAGGRYGSAGAIMLARARNGTAIHRAQRPDLIIETDGLAPGLDPLHSAIAAWRAPASKKD